MKRAFDLIVSALGLVMLSPLLLLIALAVPIESPGPALHWSKRIGRNGRMFLMPKFRTMRVDTPQLPTHLLTDSSRWLTRLGQLLRATSLDELPQLWSVLRGDMSLVGPRPALFNQDDLAQMRAEAGVDDLRPGVTGWAQVNGRDELSLRDKVAYDAEYRRRMSFLFDLRIILLTLWVAIRRQGISH